MLKGIVLLALSSFLSLNAGGLIKRTQVIMGTYASVSLTQDRLPFSSLVFKRLREVERSLSSYAEEAQIYRLNHEGEVILSKDTYEALSASKGYYEQTRGYFDITIGSITKGLFHFGEDERIPTKKELQEAKVGFKGLHFTQDKAWIEEGVRIDLGGMGKGFGVDKAIELLKEKGLKRGVVALSGDMFCLHRCEMAIQDPFSENVLAAFTMAQPNTAISTSGNYRRYVKDRDHNHLINPRTKQSQKTFSSITLISTHYTNADLDAYATAAAVMPQAEAFKFLNTLSALGYLVLGNDKKVYMNKAFKTLTKELEIVEMPGARLLYLPQLRIDTSH